MVDFEPMVTMGSTSSMGTFTAISLPVAADSFINTANIVGNALCGDFGITYYPALVRFESTTTVRIMPFNSSGASVTTLAISSTAPFTWGTGDVFYAKGTYKAA